jgi:hypothetical protein
MSSKTLRRTAVTLLAPLLIGTGLTIVVTQPARASTTGDAIAALALANYNGGTTG